MIRNLILGLVFWATATLGHAQLVIVAHQLSVVPLESAELFHEESRSASRVCHDELGIYRYVRYLVVENISIPAISDIRCVPKRQNYFIMQIVCRLVQPVECTVRETHILAFDLELQLRVPVRDDSITVKRE